MIFNGLLMLTAHEVFFKLKKRHIYTSFSLYMFDAVQF